MIPIHGYKEEKKVAIITLTTDFGTRDGYVGAMKGRILTICPEARIIDITHDIDPQEVQQAAWALVRSTPNFPAGTIHVAVIDPGVGSDRRSILMQSNRHWYIGPDNGIFTEIFKKFGYQAIYELHRDTRWRQAHSSFDGLALFSPAAASLAKGIPPENLGIPADALMTNPTTEPVVGKNSIKGQIVMFDRFGNAITNIHQNHLQELSKKQLSVTCNQHSLKLVSHYQAGDVNGLAIINSDQLLEISVFSQSAKEKLNLNIGDKISVH